MLSFKPVYLSIFFLKYIVCTLILLIFEFDIEIPTKSLNSST